jgi:hypothetical protein
VATWITHFNEVIHTKKPEPVTDITGRYASLSHARRTQPHGRRQRPLSHCGLVDECAWPRTATPPTPANRAATTCCAGRPATTRRRRPRPPGLRQGRHPKHAQEDTAPQEDDRLAGRCHRRAGGNRGDHLMSRMRTRDCWINACSCRGCAFAALVYRHTGLLQRVFVARPQSPGG